MPVSYFTSLHAPATELLPSDFASCDLDCFFKCVFNPLLITSHNNFRSVRIEQFNPSVAILDPKNDLPSRRQIASRAVNKFIETGSKGRDFLPLFPALFFVECSPFGIGGRLNLGIGHFTPSLVG